MTHSTEQEVSIEELIAVTSDGFGMEQDLLDQSMDDRRFFSFLSGQLNMRIPRNAWYGATLAGSCFSLRQAYLDIHTSTVNTDSVDHHPDRNMSRDDWNALLATLLATQTMRCILYLRFLGRFDQAPEETVHLGLGASGGGNERFGVYTVPLFKPNTASGILTFDAGLDPPKRLYLVDRDPAGEQSIVDQFTQSTDPIHQAFARMTTAITADGIAVLDPTNFDQQPTLVTAFRLAPELLPDERADKQFLARLATVIDEQADLIMTIGAGHNDSEWNDRIATIQRMYSLLGQIGYEPFFVDLTSGNSRTEPLWGLYEYTHHKLLHCKLDRNHLAQMTASFPKDP